MDVKRWYKGKSATNFINSIERDRVHNPQYYTEDRYVKTKPLCEWAAKYFWDDLEELVPTRHRYIRISFKNYRSYCYFHPRNKKEVAEYTYHKWRESNK